MQFSDLSQSDQDAILAATLLMRPLAGELARLSQKIKVALAGSGSSQVASAVASLDTGALVPNNSSLASSRDLTREQMLQLLQFGQSFTSTVVTDEVFATCVDAAGPTNCLG